MSKSGFSAEMKKKILLSILSGNENAQGMVNPRVIEYINTNLSHQQVVACIEIINDNFEGVIGHDPQDVNKAQLMIPILYGLINYSMLK